MRTTWLNDHEYAQGDDAGDGPSDAHFASVDVKQESFEDIERGRESEDNQQISGGSRITTSKSTTQKLSKGTIDMSGLLEAITDIQEHAAGLGAWASVVSEELEHSRRENIFDKSTMPVVARYQSALIQQKLTALASGFELELNPMDISLSASMNKPVPREAPISALTSMWLEHEKTKGDILADEFDLFGPPQPMSIWHPQPTLGRQNNVPLALPDAPQSLEVQTQRQEKSWRRGETHAAMTQWVIAANDGGKSLKKIPMAMYTTWQLPDRAPKCKIEDERAAKMCKSTHLSGYFAGAQLIFASNFKCCPGCDSSSKSLIRLSVRLQDGVIVAMLHPDFGVDVEGNIRLQKKSPISKKGNVIAPSQVVRTGLQEFDDRQFLGFTFEDVKRTGGTFKGPGIAPASDSFLTTHGRSKQTNRFMKRGGPAQPSANVPTKRGRSEMVTGAGRTKRAKRAITPADDSDLDREKEKNFRKAWGIEGVKSEEVDTTFNPSASAGAEGHAQLGDPMALEEYLTSTPDPMAPPENGVVDERESGWPADPFTENMEDVTSEKVEDEDSEEDSDESEEE
ncbi:hypothetical protein NX059_006287 [Plenodomus lindquistii]|nr:hypothetical protein NX059_006287 [Plenodomus lindquistii]